MACLATVWRRKTLNRALTHLRNLRLSAIYDVPGLPSGRGHLSYKEVQQSSIPLARYHTHLPEWRGAVLIRQYRLVRVQRCVPSFAPVV